MRPSSMRHVSNEQSAHRLVQFLEDQEDKRRLRSYEREAHFVMGLRFVGMACVAAIMVYTVKMLGLFP